MAEEWRRAMEGLGAERGFVVYPLIRYLATGQHNGPLPQRAWCGEGEIPFIETLSQCTLVLALTEYSASAPLATIARRHDDFRAASMPGIIRAMEETALAADYREVAQMAHQLAERLTRANGAHIRFSTGHELYIDLRYRQAEADDGLLPRHKPGLRLINLPSGEAFSAPYEGEREGDPSRTEGEIPIPGDLTPVVLKVYQNRIVDIVGEGPRATWWRETLAVDPARRNIAELGLGCNPKAVVRGNVLEDEKAGFHWAFGRSDHLGGTVDIDTFTDPSHVLHHDIVYARGNPITIATLMLEYPDGTTETIMQESTYPL